VTESTKLTVQSQEKVEGRLREGVVQQKRKGGDINLQHPPPAGNALFQMHFVFVSTHVCYQALMLLLLAAAVSAVCWSPCLHSAEPQVHSWSSSSLL
jgi:hypothetical protein